MKVRRSRLGQNWITSLTNSYTLFHNNPKRKPAKNKSKILRKTKVEGPKGCGKTTTAQQVAASVIKLQDPDNFEAYKATAESRPSIAIAALGLSPESFQYDLKSFGFFFENLCVRDLRSYTQGEDAKVSYYHDRNGLEADVVLHLKDGRYALIECKLGSKEIEDGAAHLVELRKLIVENNKGETQVPLRGPDLLIVLTGGNLAYTREDGVKVIPLACLKW